MRTESVIEEPVRGTATAGKESSQPPLSARAHQFAEFFSSLRLTVVFLCLAVVLVFIGTLTQKDEGLYAAQNRYFRSLFIWWSPAGAHWKLPIFPGGYFIGAVLLVNLLAAHAKRFKLSRKKIGILMIHAGIVLLILGQFATDLLSNEGAMRLFEGEARNYSEDFRASELVLIDQSDPDRDRVFAIPDAMLKPGTEVRDPRLPAVLKVKNYWANADLLRTNDGGSLEPGATHGELKDLFVVPRPKVNDTDSRDLPAAVVELEDAGKSVGTYLVYTGVTTRQKVNLRGKPYILALRFTRYYYPFTLTLLKATHETYKGRPDIPKNFASRVRVNNPAQHETRETVISMNNPLRYSGLTFFQYQMAAGEMAAKEGVRPSSVFQVVRNPGWLTPYFSCVLVAVGLVVQFMSHLVGFARKRRAA